MSASNIDKLAENSFIQGIKIELLTTLGELHNGKFQQMDTRLRKLEANTPTEEAKATEAPAAAAAAAAGEETNSNKKRKLDDSTPSTNTKEIEQLVEKALDAHNIESNDRDSTLSLRDALEKVYKLATGKNYDAPVFRCWYCGDRATVHATADSTMDPRCENCPECTSLRHTTQA